MRFYLTYKDHGLYDTVVDDTEVIYIPIDPEELRVVNIEPNIHETQQKTEIIDLNQIEEPSTQFKLVQPVVELLTDPDIEDLPLLINIDEIPPEGKFRLPVSDNYDPDGNRVKSDKLKGKPVVTFNVKNIINEANEERLRLQQAQDAVSEYISESKINQEKRLNEILLQADKESDENDIRDKALEVVSESIDRAVSVAKEIKEIKASEDLTELITKELSKSFEEESKDVNIRRELVKNMEYDVNVLEEIKKFEKVDSQTTVQSNLEERKLLTKHEIDESIQLGTVSKTSEIFNKENIDISKPYGIDVNKEYDSIRTQRDEIRYRDADSKQRAFSIGLQTIPHIRENVTSSQIDYRFNLLTTFFLQLTNIMVTLSRFIATEPKIILAQDSNHQRQEQHGFCEKEEKSKLDKSNKQGFKSFEKEEGQGLSKYKYENVSDISDGEIIRKSKLSGAKIAQIEGRKTAELTNKMDVVISEFQKKSGFEEQSHDQFFQSGSASRSKMKNEEDTFYESQKQKHTDHRKTYEEYSETKTESLDIHEMMSEKHTYESKTTKAEAKPYVYETNTTDDKNLTYVAIVEAHVYTNKNAIFEEQMRREREIKSQNIEKSKIETNQDLRKLSLADTIIIPKTEEISVKEVEDKVIQFEKGVTGIEQSTIKIAAKKISEVLEPLVELATEISCSVKQAHTTEEPCKTVVQSTDVSTEEFQQHFVATTVLSQKIYPSLQMPNKSVVQITEITADENDSQDLKVSKLIVEKPKSIMEYAKPIAEKIEIAIKEDELLVLDESKPQLEKSRQVVESMVKSVAETTEVVTGTNIDVLVASEKFVKTSHTTMEGAFKATAETITILPEESKSSYVESTKIKEESAKVLINEQVASEVLEVSLIEQREEALDETKIIKEQPTLLLEKSAFSVAQKTFISPVEPKSDIEIFSKVEQTANITFDELKAVESTIINLEEPGNNTFESPETIEKYPLTSMEDPHLTIAEVFTIVPDETKHDIFEVSKITECKSSIDIVEIKAAETIIVRPEEPKYEQIEVLRIEEKIPETTIEGPSLKVAEIISMQTEEAKGEFHVPEPKNQQAEITVIELEAAEATVVAVEESQHSELKIEQPKENRTKLIIEPSKLSVAEVHAPTIAESSNLIPVLKFKNQQAEITVVELKAAEATVVEVEESQHSELRIEQPKMSRTKQIIEPSILSVAEVLATTTAESSKLISKADITKKQLARIGVQEYKAIETTEVALGDLTENKIQPTSKIMTKAEATSATEARRITEIVKSVEVGRSISPTSPLSPTTPVVEEYMFSLEAELEHPYVVEETVSEEALLKIKSRKKESIQSADTSFTLAIESVIAADSETIEEIVEEENIHFNKEVHEAMYEQYEAKKSSMSANIEVRSLEANETMKNEARNLDAIHSLSVKKQIMTQDAINVSSSEATSLEEAVVERESLSSQASHISQSSSHKSRKQKSNETQYSAVQELGSSAISTQSLALASIKAEASQNAASNKEISISSKSIESTVLESNMGSERHQHDINIASGSYKKVSSSHKEVMKAASESVESKSFGSVESLSQTSINVQDKAAVQSASLTNEKLTLRTDLEHTISNGDQISPLVPPTPLTDEYMFRLQTELPEESTFIPRDCSISPESIHDDMIVNGLLTNYKTKVEERILYNPPLPTPPTSPEKTKPVYTKPGLKGGSDKELTKEEIHDSTLVSAIDRTLKQIEEYKASVGLTSEEMSYQQEEEDKEFIPIHIVEEWLDNETSHEKVNNSQVEEADAIKITVVTEETNAGETAVSITTERNVDDNDDLEIQEISSHFDEIPLEDELDDVLAEEMSSENKVINDFKPIQFDSDENLQVHDDLNPLLINRNENLEEKEEEYEFVAVHPSSFNRIVGDRSVTTNQFESEVSNINAQGVQASTTDASQELVIQYDQEIIGEEKIIPPVDSLKDSEVIKLLNEERTAVEERKWTTFLQKKYSPTPKTQVVYYGDFDVKTQYIPDAYKVKIVKQPKPKIAPDWKAEELKKESSPVIDITESQPAETISTETIPTETEPTEPEPEEPEFQEYNIEQEDNIIDQEDQLIDHKSEPEAIEDPIDKESEELEIEEMAQRNLAEELIKNVENMIDINASTEQQLEQMRDQLAALAQLPSVIQQTVELVNKRINLISQKEQQKKKEEEEYRRQEEEKRAELEKTKQSLEMRVTKTEEELAIIKKEEVKRILEDKIRKEKQNKEKMELMKVDQVSRQVTQRSTPRVGKPMPVFGPLQERPVILPGGRKWRTPEDVYDEEFISESLVGQAEVIKGSAIGVNFMKFEKPPPALDHLKHSEVFKALHESEQPLKKVDLLGAVLSEADYREKARSMSPCVEKIADSSLNKQFHP